MNTKPSTFPEELKPFSPAAQSLVEGSFYKHYKGLLYKLISVARHSETLEEMVVYQALYNDYSIWVRPLKMFMEKIEINGRQQDRFKKVESPVTLNHKEPCIELELKPSGEDLSFLTDQINQETPAYRSATPYAFFVRDAANKIIAGCNGFVIYGSIYTDQLWVDQKHRKKDWGRKLMEKVQAYGKEQDCGQTVVSTMDFQAPSFYKKLGYHIDFTRENCEKGSCCYYLSKSI